VHPVAYPVVERILAKVARNVRELMGNATPSENAPAPPISPDERFGLPTVPDISPNSKKPGRDPRPEFRTATSAKASRRSRIWRRA